MHLPGGRRIITCSCDGSLRLWDLESGAQIGNDWRDGDEERVLTIALSPSGNTVASTSPDGTVRLWDVETGKVIARWTGHTHIVKSVCWSADGERVLSGSDDGTARVWDIKSGRTVLATKTGHDLVLAVTIYSPDATKIATGGIIETAVKIWDGKTGELLYTVEHAEVCSLGWTLDEKKLISGLSNGSIRIIDTATWQQIVILEGHQNVVTAISLFRNNRLLASASNDNTARLWNLDTNLPVGPPLQHKDKVECAAISDDGKLLVTGSGNDVYVWHIYVILKEAGLEDLLSIPDVSVNNSPT